MTTRGPSPSRSVAVDLGGTWLRAVVLVDGVARRRLRRPAHRLPDLRRVLLTLAGRTPPVRALVVAARGVWTATERAAVGRALRGLARRIAVVSDAEAAFHGALGARPGLLILSGTGSIVLAHDGAGRWTRAGGLGPLLGDEGSAFAIGRAWLREAESAHASRRARQLARQPDAVRRIAALAPAVLQRARRGDRRARAIARAAQDDLARLALTAARRARLSAPVAVSWAGSVMANPWFRHGVARALRRTGLAGQWTAPAAAPVDGAARLAAALATTPSTASPGVVAARPSRRTTRPPREAVTRTGGVPTRGSHTAPVHAAAGTARTSGRRPRHPAEPGDGARARGGPGAIRDARVGTRTAPAPSGGAAGWRHRGGRR